MIFFKCKHPASRLVVRTDATEEPNSKYPKDYIDVTYHLRCMKCNKDINIKYAHLIGGVDEFLKRKTYEES